MDEKRKLREAMRSARAAHVAALPDATRALMFLRPPGAIAALAPEGTTIGLYHAGPTEAPSTRWAQWFYENGRTTALPWFADKTAPMQFKAWLDPFDCGDLEPGPFGLQPTSANPDVVPELVTVPLLAFTRGGHRLGQGGGHYDRWLTVHPEVIAIGLAWDVQLAETLPVEPHDRSLHAVVTPTRLYEGAA